MARKALTMLSAVEQSVLEEFAKHAQDNDQIAKALGMTRRNVKFHLSNVLQKFGVASRDKLILLYWQERCRSLQRRQNAKTKTTR